MRSKGGREVGGELRGAAKRRWRGVGIELRRSCERQRGARSARAQEGSTTTSERERERETHIVFLAHAANLDAEEAEPGAPVRAAAEQVPQVVHEEDELPREVGVRVRQLEEGLRGELEAGEKGRVEGRVAEDGERGRGGRGGGREEVGVDAAAESLVQVGRLDLEVG